MPTQLFIFRSLTVLFTVVLVASCNTSEPEPAQPYDKGVLVLNAGNFFDNNGSLSLFSKETKATTSFDVFQKENGRSLAGGVVDYAEISEKGLILVDNSTAGKDVVEIINARTFKSVASIVGQLENPRRVVKAADDKAYVVCWDAFNPDFSYKVGYVAVIDLKTNKVTKKITVQNGAEDIVVVGNEAFVGNTSFSGQKVLTVIDISKDEVSQKIEIGAGLKSFVVDKNNKIWLALGKEIIRFNAQTKTIETRIMAGTHAQKTPSKLTFNQDKTTLFFTYTFDDATDGYKTKGEVYSLNINETTAKPLITRPFAALGYDPDNNILYTSLIPSYKQSGYVFRYNMSGALIDSTKAEIAPSAFFIK